MSLVVAGGDVFVVGTTETLLVGNNPEVNGTLEVNGVLKTYPVELQAGRILEVTDSQTITGTDTEYSAEVAGTLTVEGTLTLDNTVNPALDEDTAQAALFVARILQAVANDTDSLNVSLDRIRDLAVQTSDTDSLSVELVTGLLLEATASDSDTTTGKLTRLRLLDGDGVDTDTSIATAERVRLVGVTATDTDTAQTEFVVSSFATDPREVAIDLLKGNSGWPGDEPEFYLAEEVPMKGRQNNRNTAIYVQLIGGAGLNRYAPTDQTLQEIETVRVDIWTLEGESTAREYRNEVINTFRRYMADNFTRTKFHDVQPTDSTDFREQKIARQTDHYIYSVEIEFERLVENF